MGVFFGLIAAVVFSVLAAVATTVLGYRDGHHPGDARVVVRAVPGHPASGQAAPGHTATPEVQTAGAAVFAEILIENGHDSPVMVSARCRRASALALALASPSAQRTALAHRRRLDGVQLLGAVDGRASHRYLLPLDGAHAATRVTVVVDQVARRTRITTAMLRASAVCPLRSASPRDAADA